MPACHCSAPTGSPLVIKSTLIYYMHQVKRVCVCVCETVKVSEDKCIVRVSSICGNRDKEVAYECRYGYGIGLELNNVSD